MGVAKCFIVSQNVSLFRCFAMLQTVLISLVSQKSGCKTNEMSYETAAPLHVLLFCETFRETLHKMFWETKMKQAKKFAKQPLTSLVFLNRETALHHLVKNPLYSI
jgi:hypothetical protein